MTRTPQQIGRSNRRAGKDWQLACSAWLRAHGYPYASYEIREGAGDITGVGDVSTECTITTWDKIWIKVDQAARDAKRRGFDVYVVWKKRNGATDPGEGLVLVPARLFWPLMADLDAYRRTEMDAQDAYDRGYSAAMRARLTEVTQEGSHL